ncbi:hypothetical protein C8J57DRAFT_1240666 [Mycena rebaudengoi]|nr:hypothetical protein C8J57DRAFT_1240666 [Mycena rebaudengoi]
MTSWPRDTHFLMIQAVSLLLLLPPPLVPNIYDKGTGELSDDNLYPHNDESAMPLLHWIVNAYLHTPKMHEFLRIIAMNVPITCSRLVDLFFEHILSHPICNHDFLSPSPLMHHFIPRKSKQSVEPLLVPESPSASTTEETTSSNAGDDGALSTKKPRIEGPPPSSRLAQLPAPDGVPLVFHILGAVGQQALPMLMAAVPYDPLLQQLVDFGSDVNVQTAQVLVVPSILTATLLAKQQHEDPIVSKHVIKTSHAFTCTMELVHELRLLSHHVNNLILFPDPAHYTTLKCVRAEAERKYSFIKVLGSNDPLLMEGVRSCSIPPRPLRSKERHLKACIA